MSKGTKMFAQMLVKAEAEKVKLQDRIIVLNEAIAEVDSRILKLKTIISDIESIKGITSAETTHDETINAVQTC